MNLVLGRTRDGVRGSDDERDRREEHRTAQDDASYTRHRSRSREDSAGAIDDAGMDETDLYRQDHAGQEDMSDVQLPRARRRQYMTLLTVFTMIITAASCILVGMLLKGQSESAAVNDARNQAMEDKLSAIEASLGALDQTVVLNSGAAAANTAASYEELGNTVDSLRSNLTDYRDNHEIQNEEIGEHLDRVIAQLDRIKEDMSDQQAQGEQEENQIGSRIDSLTQTSVKGTANLTEELDAVHKDIAALIDKAGDDQNGNYKELKGILTATDTSLSDLVADKFDETGDLIASSMSRIQGSIANVSGDLNDGFAAVNDRVSAGLSDVNASVEEGLLSMDTSVHAGMQSVSADIADVNTGLSGALERLSGLAENVDSVDRNMRKAQDTVQDLSQLLEDYAEETRETDTALRANVDLVQTSLTSMDQDLTTQMQEITRQIGGAQESIDAIRTEETQVDHKGMYEALSGDLQTVSQSLAATREQVDSLDDKLDRILSAMGQTDPDPEPDPDPDPVPVVVPDSEAGQNGDASEGGVSE